MIRQTILYLPAQLLSPLAMFVASVLWTHMLDAEAYGIVSYVLVAQELIYLLTFAFWSYYSLRYRGSLVGEQRDRMVRADNTVVLVGALAHLVVAVPLVEVLETSVSPGLFAAATVIFVTRSLLTHYSEIARSEEAILTYTVAQLAGPLVGSAASFAGVAMFGGSATAALVGIAAAQTLGLAIVMMRLGIRARLEWPDRSLLRSALFYGLPVIFAGQLGWISSNAIRLLVERMAGADALGLLSVGWGLGQRLASVAAMLLFAAAFPIAARRFESGDEEGALEQMALNGSMLFGLLAPTAVGVTLVTRPLVELMIAESYRSATIAVLPIAILIGAVRNQSNHHFGQIFLLRAATTRLVPLNILEAVATVVCVAIGLKLGGSGDGALVGATLGCLAGASIGTTVTGWAAIRVCGLRPQWSVWGRILVACAGMAAVVAALPMREGVLGLAVAVVVGAVVYGALLVALIPPIRRILRERIAARRAPG